jgi:hypothetical protein
MEEEIMRNDHKAAKKRAEKMIANSNMFIGEMFNRDNIMMAACYLELLELANAHLSALIAFPTEVRVAEQDLREVIEQGER